jgi:hypothetical protein
LKTEQLTNNRRKKGAFTITEDVMGKIKISFTIEVIDFEKQICKKPSVKKSTMQKEIDYVPCNCKMTNDEWEAL